MTKWEAEAVGVRFSPSEGGLARRACARSYLCAVTQTEQLDLASTFPQATREQWQALVGKVLKTDAAEPDALLATPTLDGVELQPLYDSLALAAPTGLPGEFPFVRGRTAEPGWDVRALNGHPDADVTREQVMADLEGGAGSVWLQVGEGRLPVAGIPAALAEVYLDLATVSLDAGEQGVAAAEAFLAFAVAKGGAFLGQLGLDPIGQLARTGIDPGMAEAVALAQRCVASHPGVRALVVDTLPFHEAGASPAQEIGIALASGVAYLRALDGLPVEQALTQLEFRFAATADQFTTIATLRAARRTWARVAEACGVTGPAAGQLQHAVSSFAMTTRRDPWSNLLRGTIACFGAGVGGADAVTVLPFDAALGLPDKLARRMARNTQALVVEEAYVAKVLDPAGGSWYVETLTEQLAQAAWAFFQEIESAGGIVSALGSGMLSDRIAAHREARRAAVAQRTEPITGVTEFPLLPEVLLDREADLRPEPTGLPRLRWAQWHEELRDRSDAHALKTGTVPTLEVGAGSDVKALRSALASSGVLVAVADGAADFVAESDTVALGERVLDLLGVAR